LRVESGLEGTFMVDTAAPAPDEQARDEADLARFGYKQELKRTLGVFSSFAVAFSYISPSTGIFALFFLGLTTIGGVFIWSWPIVAIGQLMIALGWAELSSHYPVAGSVFQWTKYLAGKTYSWFAGWIYLFAGILTVASVCATLPIALIPAFNNMGWNISASSLHNQRLIALITLGAITVMNIFGVRLVAIVNNTGVLFEILGMVVFAFVVALFHHHQGGGVIFHTGGTSLTTGTFLVAMFMSLYVIYGFDTASTLAEETKRPRTEAPKAVIGSVIGAFVIGAVFLYAMLLGIPNMKTAIAEGWGPAQIIDANFGNAFSTVFLLVVSAAIFVCCLSIMTSTIRLCFGMARDQRLPGSKLLREVNPALHTPIWSCLAVGALAAIPMAQYAGVAIIAIAATGMIYLSYLIGSLALLRARLRGWPRAKAPFSLGRWALPVNLLAIGWGGGMLINMAWPRAATNPRPSPEAPGLDFHWHWLNRQPVLWTVLVVIVIVGAVYYALVQRTKPAHLQAPEGEVLAAEAPEVPAAGTT
jgi:urea carboxylase system permease